MSDSAAWFERATAVMPGGVNSPVRAFKAVGGIPVFAKSAKGAHLTTEDGVELLDLVASWGALLFGHADPEVVAAIAGAAAAGTSFGMPTAAEVELAELVVSMVPGVEVVRMVNSGTEATASAIRLARAATGRKVLVKFEGCYHGHADPFLVKAGSGAATFGEPDSPGVPAATVADTRVVGFNDLAGVEAALAPGDVAAVIVEPVAGNMGVVPPEDGFLVGLRRLCDRHGTLLVLDEVMTGFRLAPGGAQELYGVTGDLVCLGKVVAGGTPAAAYGGRADLMRMIAPDGPVYQAGTLAGNPIVTAAGLVTLRRIAADGGLHARLDATGAHLQHALEGALARLGVPGCVQRVGAMMTLFLGPTRVRSWAEASTVDRDAFGRFFRAALERGILLPPSPFEAWFIMDAHADHLDDLVTGLVGALEDAHR